MLQKKDFAFTLSNPDLVYLDAGATTLVPQKILNSFNNWYSAFNCNVHHINNTLGASATNEYENARYAIAKLFKVKENEIIFVRSATEALNLIAYRSASILKPGENIVLSELEHHSNILPWLAVAKKTDAELRFIKVKSGRIDIEDASKKITAKTKIVSLSRMSNVFGTKQQLDKIVKLSRTVRANFIVDGTQAVAHFIDDDLDYDAYVFSGHKVYAPTGIGVAILRQKFAQKLDHFWLGGGVVTDAADNEYTLKRPPLRFEAGTPNTGGAVALAQALALVHGDHENQKKMEKLKNFLYPQLSKIKNLEIYSPPTLDIPLITFSIKNVKPSETALLLDRENIIVRSGFLCAKKAVSKLNPAGVVRVSVGLWNDKKDVETFISSVKKIAVNTN